MFGPGWSLRLADPEGEIITLEVETPSGLLQERTVKVRGGPGSLACQTLGGTILAIGPPAC